MKRKSILLLLALLLISILATTLLTAQTTRVPIPRDVPGTIKNVRPIVYDKGKYGGTFVDSIVGEPKTLNESQSSDATSSSIIQYTAPYLMDLNYDNGEWEVFLGDQKKGTTGPGYDLEVTEDGEMVVTIYLRKDIYWTDGTRMTADDWVFWHNEIVCNEDIGHPSSGATWVEMPNGDEIQTVCEKVDRWSFKKIYPRTAGEPELSTNFNIMPRHILKPVLDSEGPDGIIEMWGVDTPVNELVGYGPWIIDKYEIGSGIIFKRNERYFNKDEWNNRLPYLNSYIMQNVSDVQTATLKFQNKELDTVFVQTSDFKTLVEGAEAGGYDVWNGGNEIGRRYIVFNQNPNSERLKGSPKLTWFTEKKFRHAMSYLIDRETLLLQAYQNLGEPADTLLHPASHYHDENVTFNPEYNPKKAFTLLDEIGMRDRNGDGIFEDKNGNNIEFELVTNTGYEYKEKTVTLVAKEWTAAGIKCIPVLLEFNIVNDLLDSSFDWDSHYMTLTGGTFPISVNVWPSDGNLHVWHPFQEEPATEWEAEIDRLHNEAMYEPDFETRKALFSEMFSILYDELPLIPMVRKYDFYAFYSDIGNVYWDPFVTAGDNEYMRLYRK